MGFKEQYFDIWQQVWSLHKKYYVIQEQDAEILKNFSKDMEMWKACEEDEIADAKEKYTSKAFFGKSQVEAI